MTEKMKKLLVPAFLLSLAVNIFVIGFLVGQDGPGKHHKKYRGHGPVEFSLHSLKPVLTDAQLDQLKERMRAGKGDFIKALRERRTLRSTLYDQITAETVNVDAIRETMTALQDIEGNLRTQGAEIMLELLPSLDQEARKMVADHMMRRKDRLKDGLKDGRKSRCQGDLPPPVGDTAATK